MIEESDEFLVTASRKGGRQAYARLVERHSRRVYAVCMGILGNPTDSDDIAQETFIKGFFRIQTLQKGQSFGSWIATIARNLFHDHIRVNSRRRELLRERISKDVRLGEDFSTLHSAIAELREEYRTPLMLFYFDGQSAKKLAKELEISHAGACTRLSRARKELRRILEEKAGSK